MITIFRCSCKKAIRQPLTNGSAPEGHPHDRILHASSNRLNVHELAFIRTLFGRIESHCTTADVTSEARRPLDMVDPACFSFCCAKYLNTSYREGWAAPQVITECAVFKLRGKNLGLYHNRWSLAKHEALGHERG